MHRANFPKVSKGRSSHRSHEDSFEKEDSPNLPVPPRRKTNTLSMLRKFFDEYDEIDSQDMGPNKQLGRSSSRIQQDVNNEVPDHCWVGEYLDDGEVNETSGYSSLITAALHSLRGKPQNLPSSSGSTLASFSFADELLASHRNTDTYKTKFDDATDREIKELQRKEKEREEQLYKIMLESLEYKAELERLKREASLKKSRDSAKVFDYGHGTSDQSREVPISQHQRISSRQRESDHYMEQEYKLPRSNHQRGVGLVSQGAYSTFDIPVFSSEHDPGSSRKIVMDSNKVDSAFISPDIQQKQKVNVFERGYYGDRSSVPEKSGRTLRKFRNRDSDDGGTASNVGQEHRSSSGTMSSFGSAFSHIVKVTKNSASQSYEDYLDELQLKLQEEEEALMGSKKLMNESMRDKSDKTSLDINKGLPISVLTSAERVGSRNAYRSDIQSASTGTPPPLKIKPALKNLRKDVFKKEMPGSGSLVDSLEEISASSRLKLGNFNDTRTVLMEDSQPYDSQLGYGDRVVVDRDSHEATSSSNETYSLNPHSWRLTKREDQRIGKESSSNLSFSPGVINAMDCEYDDFESEPFLHRSRSKEGENALVETLPFKKSLPRKHYESKSPRASSATSLDRDVPSHVHSSRGRVDRTGEENQPLGGKSLYLPKHHIHALHTSQKAHQRSPSPASHYSNKSTKSSGKRTRGCHGHETNDMSTSYRHSLLKSTSRERSDKASSDRKRQRCEDSASRSNNEYIDQFFDRQIKIWSESCSKVQEVSERLVERHPQKSQLTWEEEVDRYVNMSTGVDKRVTAARDDRQEDITLDKRRRRGGRRGRRQSHIDIPTSSLRNSKSHSSTTPSTNRQLKNSRSPFDSGTNNQHSRSGKDERRFRRRSPPSEAEQSVSTMVSKHSDFRKSTNSKSSENSWANEGLPENRRSQLKRPQPSPSPVPLMPTGWRPAKIRKLRNSNRSTSSLKRKDEKGQKESMRNVVRRESQHQHRRNVISKGVAGDHNALSKAEPIMSISHGADQLKRTESSPSPVPLMSSGWHPAKTRVLSVNNKRSTSSVKHLDNQSKNATQRDVISEGAKNKRERNLMRKTGAVNNSSGAAPSKSVKSLLIHKGRSNEVTERIQDLSTDGTFGTTAENLKTRGKSDIREIPPLYVDKKQSATNMPRVTEKSTSTEAREYSPDNRADGVLGEVSSDNTKDTLLTGDESLKREENALKGKLLNPPPIIAKGHSASSPPPTALSRDVESQKTLYSKDARDADLTGTDVMTAVQTQPKRVVLSTSTKSVNVRKASTSVGRGKKILTQATGMKRIQKAPLKRQPANSKLSQNLRTKPKLPMKMKPSVDAQNNSKVINLSKPVKPPGAEAATSSSKTEDVISSEAARDICVVEGEENWKERYQNWFNKFLQATLAKDEFGRKLGWDDPVQFLNCVTFGNKRAMSYIPRGAHAKEMLRFIALNKKATSVPPGATSNDPKIDEKSVGLKVDGGNRASDMPSNNIELQKNEVAEAQELLPCDASTNNGEKETMSCGKSSQPGSGSNKSNEDQKNLLLKDAKRPGVHLVKQNAPKPDKVKGKTNVTKKMEVTKTLPGLACGPSVTTACVSTDITMQNSSGEKELGFFIDRQGDSSRSNVVNIVKSSIHAHSNEPPKLMPSLQSPSTNKTQDSEIQLPDEMMKEEILPPDCLEEKIPETAHKNEPIGAEKIVTVLPTDSKKNTKQQPRKTETTKIAKISPMTSKGVKLPSKSLKQRNREMVQKNKPADMTKKLDDVTPNSQIIKELPERKESTDTLKIAPAAMLNSKHDNSQKKVSVSPTFSGVRDSYSESHRNRESYDEEIGIPKEEPMLNSAQEGLLPAFKKYVRRTTTRTLNILYGLDHYHKRKLTKAARDILDAFSISKNKRHGFTKQHALYYMALLFKNPPADSLDDVQRQFRKSDLDGPQFEFSLQAFLAFKVFRKESSSRPHVKLEPFPDDCGETMEDRIVMWMKRVLHQSIYNETDNYGHAVICAVKTELMKRKSHATRQEAMNLVMRSCIKELFHGMEMRRKDQEKSPDSSEDLESSELMVLDEVYSDESEDENVLDMVDDSGSIQIDDSESVEIDLF